jgi:hypothetical protein
MFKSGMVWVSGEVSSERIIVVIVLPSHMSKRPQSDGQKFICLSFLYALAYAIWPTAVPGPPIMSSKKFKSQASSARAASSTFGFGGAVAFQTAASPLSYVTELPDLNTISEPKVVVAYKNLSKKDSVTKAKALEELQDYLSHVGESGVENAVLEAWVGLPVRKST